MKKNYLLAILFLGFSQLLFSQQNINASFTFQGELRQYIIHVPTAYNAANPTPLVISLHGLGDDMTNFSQAGFHAVADTANFIVVTPQAVTYSVFGQSITAWNSGVGAYIDLLGQTIFPNENIDDVAFISALIDTLATDYNIDQDRVYSTGFSMGGFMTNRLAVELNDRIAAAASVSGTIGINVDRSQGSPIPLMHIHGTGDATVAYSGASQSNGLYTILGDSVNGLLSYWEHTNIVDTNSLQVNTNYATVSGLTVERYDWMNTNDTIPVVHYKVLNGDHNWYQPFYPVEIWNFFKQYKNKSVDGPTGIKPNVLALSSIYPNPTQNVLHINLNTQIDKISIYNAVGQLVLSNENQHSINTNELSIGIYQIVVSSQNKNYQAAIVKE